GGGLLAQRGVGGGEQERAGVDGRRGRRRPRAAGRDERGGRRRDPRGGAGEDAGGDHDGARGDRGHRCGGQEEHGTAGWTAPGRGDGEGAGEVVLPAPPVTHFGEFVQLVGLELGERTIGHVSSPRRVCCGVGVPVTGRQAPPDGGRRRGACAPGAAGR